MEPVSQAIQIALIGYIVSALIIITLFTLIVITLSAKIKFYKKMNQFIDENKDRVSSIIADSVQNHDIKGDC